jgi:hypothetical protein
MKMPAEKLIYRHSEGGIKSGVKLVSLHLCVHRQRREFCAAEFECRKFGDFWDHMSTLMRWLGRFAIPSVLSIVATYLALRFMQRDALSYKIAADVDVPALSRAGKTTDLGIIVMAAVMLAASAFDVPLGLFRRSALASHCSSSSAFQTDISRGTSRGDTCGKIRGMNRSRPLANTCARTTTGIEQQRPD